MIASPIRTNRVADAFSRPPSLAVIDTCNGYMATARMSAQTMMLINGRTMVKHIISSISKAPICRNEAMAFERNF
jgi:hypothetical protein